jgi:Ni/Fe-hydrogenase subunit HybB-like protein
MGQFEFTGREKNVLLGFMALGAFCLGMSFFMDSTPFHTRFWTNLLHNSVFFTGISFMSLFVWSAKSLAYAGWHTVFKRIWEANAQFLVVGLGLMTVIALGMFFKVHHLYHWADDTLRSTDVILKGKSGFLNPYTYLFATIGCLSLFYFVFARGLRKISIEQDEAQVNDFSHYAKTKRLAGIFLPIAGFSSAALIWYWIMSIDPHWYSTMFAWYTTASWFVSAIAFTILILIYLKSRGYYQEVTTEHFHDLGKLMFGFSIFWTYLWFSQFMLIWYANIGEETIYFDERMRNYPILFWANLIMNFLFPLIILMRNDTKRKYGTLIFIALVVIFGHWLDFFQMIKPGALHTAHEMEHAAAGHGAVSEATHGGVAPAAHAVTAEHAVPAAHGAAEHAVATVANAAEHGAAAVAHGAEAVAEHGEALAPFTTGFTLPGFLEIGTFFGFTALFLFFVFNQLTKASLVPKHDPYLQESLNHHT